jgi:hypothetical protein
MVAGPNHALQQTAAAILVPENSSSLSATAAAELNVSRFEDQLLMVHSSIDSILDASTIDAIRASSTATCEILDPEAASPHPVGLTPARQLTSVQLSELKGLLLDPQSWFFAKKRCLPRETALFRLQSDECYVMVLIDRPCVGWIVTGPRGRRGGFFDPVQNQIWDMVKGLFPEYASPSRRSMWRSGVIAELRAATESGDGRG